MTILKLFGVTVASMLFGGTPMLPAKVIYVPGGSSRYGRS